MPTSGTFNAVTIETLESAWQRYLDNTRHVEAARYDEVEPWAWARLQDALFEIVTHERVAYDGAA